MCMCGYEEGCKKEDSGVGWVTSQLDTESLLSKVAQATQASVQIGF